MTNLRDEDPEGQYSRSRTSEAMPILRHLRVIRRFGIYILASVVVAIVLAFFGSAMLPRTYESRASLYVGQRLDDVSLDYDGVLASQRLAETYARIALTEPVLNAVRQRLQLDATIEEMEARVRTELPLEETVLTVIAQSGDPGEAAAVANAVVDELRERAPADQAAERAAIGEQLAALDEEIDAIEGNIQDLLDQPTLSAGDQTRLTALQRHLDSLNARYARLNSRVLSDPPSTITVIQPAPVPATPVAPRRTLIIGAAALIALAAALAIAYVADSVSGDSASAHPPPSVAAVTGFPGIALRLAELRLAAK